MKIMTFRIAEQIYGVDLSHVDTVQREAAAIDVGSAATECLPLDLRALLGHPVEPHRSGAVIVLQAHGLVAAVHVDAPGEVLEVAAGALLDLPRFFAAEVARGVVEVDERLVIMLDAKALIREASRAPGATRISSGGEA